MRKSIIGYAKMNSGKMNRFIHLNSAEIFKALVGLYDTHFRAQWGNLSMMINPSESDYGTVDPVIYLASVYITHWFIDLYVSIREACLKNECVEVSDHFDKVQSTQSTYYDGYLTLLLESLKPTHTKGALEDALYIPVIAKHNHWTSTTKDYFGIAGWTLNLQLFRALISTMRNPSSGWHVFTPSNDPLGRPFWLLDWHETYAYAWFPEEENYNIEDVNLAFILGVPCTPPMSVRDTDDYQQFPRNVIPDEIDVKKYIRKVPKKIPSNVDHRTIEHHQLTHKKTTQVTYERPVVQVQTSTVQYSAASSPAMETVTEDMEIEYRINLYRIVDYKYYARVVRDVDVNVRSAAHKILVYKEEV
ncbi:coat protein [Artemisia annua]|uniref:Coat protein n=1 Tax=Artemisia annua TaxID=35608 RepID=A0A2U1MET1_ARTAN|nr:coat protein [Artemisia annua]